MLNNAKAVVLFYGGVYNLVRLKKGERKVGKKYYYV